MKSLIVTALFGGALVLSASAAPPDELTPKQKEDIAPVPLEGGYTITSGERGGKAIPAAEIKGLIVRITRNDIVGTGKDRKELYAADYTLDTTKTPWKIEMKTVAPAKPFPSGDVPKEGLMATGLVKKEGDTITLIYALPGGDTPTEFKTKDKQQMFVMKSIADGKVFPNKFPEEPSDR